MAGRFFTTEPIVKPRRVVTECNKSVELGPRLSILLHGPGLASMVKRKVKLKISLSQTIASKKIILCISISIFIFMAIFYGPNNPITINVIIV